MWYKESQGNVNIPADRNPVRSTKYVRQYNLENRQNSSRKYYIIRVYDYEDGNYSVIAYSGRIGGRTPTTQPKGMYRSLSSAMDVAQSLASIKISGGYRDQGDFTRTNIPVGTPSNATPSSPTSPTQPSRPTDAVFNATQARSTHTPPEQLEAALFNDRLHISLRCEVAENLSVPPEALLRFVTEHSDNPTPNEVTILTRIAKNISTPPLALDTLLRKFYLRDRAEAPSNVYTSLWVVKNNKTPQSALKWVVDQEVATSEEPSVIAEIAVDSGKLPISTIAKWRINFKDKYEGGNARYIEAMIALFDGALSSQNPEVQQEVSDLLSGSDYMMWTENSLVESFINKLLSTEAFQQIALSKFPKEFFDHISMTSQNREVVEQYFGASKEYSPHTSIMEGLFAKNKNWYKKAMISESGRKG